MSDQPEKTGKSMRSLASLELTRKFHSRYFGLWIGVTVVMLILLDAVLFIYLYTTPTEIAGAATVRTSLTVTIVLISVAFLAGLIFMSKVTANRIAGPYIQLQRTCEKIADGDREARLSFRDYDGLEEAQAAVNRMIDVLQSAADDKPTES